MALSVGVKIPWLEQQTGVRYDTLRRHYGKWIPQETTANCVASKLPNPVCSGANWTPESALAGSNLEKSRVFAGQGKVREGGLEPPWLPTGF